MSESLVLRESAATQGAPRWGEITPSLEEFRALARDHRVIPVSMRLLADSATPVSLYASLTDSGPGTFLMESAAAGGVWSQHSFIGVSSQAILYSRDGQAHWEGQPPASVPRSGAAVSVLQETLELLQTPSIPYLPPLTSGLVGFMGWDVVRAWERLENPPEDDLNIPEVALNLVADLAVHDNTDSSVWLVANAFNHDGSDERVDQAWEAARDRVLAMVRKIRDGGQGLSAAVLSEQSTSAGPAITQSWSNEIYEQSLEAAKKDIVDGEIFQIVLSRRFELENHAPAIDVYRALRASNPSPYMYLYEFVDAEGVPFSIVGSSPEALVTVKGRDVITHPIAGSRPRGRDRSHDAEQERDLLADDKERAEHLMLVDLSRNDLSKVCEPGSVEVTQFMQIERFSHIMHLVSTVEGVLSSGRTAYDTLAATFPAGTLSGAPKPRALQLIDTYEPRRRGVYGGVVGYFDFVGNLDAAICIRTALLKNRTAYVQAGGGIVADSVIADEARESWTKASAPLRAVVTANRLTGLGEVKEAETQLGEG